MKLSKFNTAIASLMEYVTELSKAYNSSMISKSLWFQSLERLLLHLAPLAPHISEELWLTMGKEYSIHNQNLPTFDESLTVSDSIN